MFTLHLTQRLNMAAAMVSTCRLNQNKYSCFRKNFFRLFASTARYERRIVNRCASESNKEHGMILTVISVSSGARTGTIGTLGVCKWYRYSQWYQAAAALGRILDSQNISQSTILKTSPYWKQNIFRKKCASIYARRWLFKWNSQSIMLYTLKHACLQMMDAGYIQEYVILVRFVFNF